jgi:hypothetical protein
LYPLASLRPLIESIANLTAVDADIFQIPIAKAAQSEKVRLALAVCDYAVDETAERAPEKQRLLCGSRARRSVSWC